MSSATSTLPQQTLQKPITTRSNHICHYRSYNFLLCMRAQMALQFALITFLLSAGTWSSVTKCKCTHLILVQKYTVKNIQFCSVARTQVKASIRAAQSILEYVHVMYNWSSNQKDTVILCNLIRFYDSTDNNYDSRNIKNISRSYIFICQQTQIVCNIYEI